MLIPETIVEAVQFHSARPFPRTDAIRLPDRHAYPKLTPRGANSCKFSRGYIWPLALAAGPFGAPRGI
jgi:hypothetical protein